MEGGYNTACREIRSMPCDMHHRYTPASWLAIKYSGGACSYTGAEHPDSLPANCGIGESAVAVCHYESCQRALCCRWVRMHTRTPQAHFPLLSLRATPTLSPAWPSVCKAPIWPLEAWMVGWCMQALPSARTDASTSATSIAFPYINSHMLANNSEHLPQHSVVL